VDETRARQREEFGGFSFGSVFFGWLVAIGLAVLLTAVLTAAGTAIGIAELDDGELSDNAETIGLLGGILLFAVLFLSYYAGRLARFDGARQGFGVWILGVLVTAAFAALAALAGSEWNVFEQLDLPRIPVDEGTLTTGGAITLVAIVLGTLLAGIAGGKVGERFHRKVDRVGFDSTVAR
jgi:MFS family permease